MVSNEEKNLSTAGEPNDVLCYLVSLFSKSMFVVDTVVKDNRITDLVIFI